jgi:hypothetical protein
MPQANPWENAHASDSRFLATDYFLETQGEKVSRFGVAQIDPSKIYHDNAENWLARTNDPVN